MSIKNNTEKVIY